MDCVTVHQQRSFPRIQALRFFAAAAVVVYHAQITAISYFGGPKPYPVFEFGVYGVDLFFVISGFIIVFIGSTKENSATLFARKRIQRIVPLYWIMTVVTFVLTHIPGLARNEVSDFKHLFESLAFFSWINGPATYPVLNVGWTLEYEMFFYAIVVAAMACTKRWWLIAACIMLTLVVTGRGTSFFLQNPIMVEFVLGMTIGTFLYDRTSFPWMMSGTALAILTLPLTVLTRQVYAFGISAAVMVAIAIYADMRKPYLGKVLPELGNASYSIYLVHVIAISFLCKIASVVMPRLSVTLVVPLVSLFAIVVGYVSYRLIERNLLGMFGRRRRAALASLEPIA